MDGFISQLRLLKLRSGNPSITEITRRIHKDWRLAGRPRAEWPARSTVGNCFQVGRRRLNPDLLLAVVRVLVDGDQELMLAWRRALHMSFGEADTSVAVHVSEKIPARDDGTVERLAPLDEACSLVEERAGARTLVLEGAAGTGKTVLAFELGRRVAARTTGPTLVVDLQGTRAEGDPVSPFTVLAHLLRILGTPESCIPATPEARSALFRRLLAGTGALLILDDAFDADQVRSLLPGPGAGRTVITTRRPLTDLGVPVLKVPPCEPGESLQILQNSAGASRIESDPLAAMLVTEAVGHIPQAVAIIGRHMARHPEWALSDYHDEVLGSLVLRGGLGAAFAASERKVPPEARRMLRLLTLQASSLPDADTAARLLGVPLDVARGHLSALAGEGMLQRVTPDLYYMARLVQVYARTRLRIDEPLSRVQEAVGRLRCLAESERDVALR